MPLPTDLAQLYHFVVGWPWGSCFTLYNLSFFIYKREATILEVEEGSGSRKAATLCLAHTAGTADGAGPLHRAVLRTAIFCQDSGAGLEMSTGQSRGTSGYAASHP